MSKAEDTLLKLLRPKAISETIVKAVEDTQSPVPPPTKRTKLQNVKRSNAGLNVAKQPGKKASREPVSKKGAKPKESASVKEKMKTPVAQPIAASEELSPSVSNPPLVTTPHQARMRTASRTPSISDRNREDAVPERQTPRPLLQSEYATASAKQRQHAPEGPEPLYFDYEGHVCHVVDD